MLLIKTFVGRNKTMSKLRKGNKQDVKNDITNQAKNILETSECPVCRVWVNGAGGRQISFGVGLGGEDPLNRPLSKEEKKAMATRFVRNMSKVGEIQKTGNLIPALQWEDLKWILVSFKEIGSSYFESAKSYEQTEEYKCQRKWFLNFQPPDWA
jgi:hypothetical protein